MTMSTNYDNDRFTIVKAVIVIVASYSQIFIAPSSTLPYSPCSYVH